MTGDARGPPLPRLSPPGGGGARVCRDGGGHLGRLPRLGDGGAQVPAPGCLDRLGPAPAVAPARARRQQRPLLPAAPCPPEPGLAGACSQPPPAQRRLGVGARPPRPARRDVRGPGPVPGHVLPRRGVGVSGRDPGVRQAQHAVRRARPPEDRVGAPAAPGRRGRAYGALPPDPARARGRTRRCSMPIVCPSKARAACWTSSRPCPTPATGAGSATRSAPSSPWPSAPRWPGPGASPPSRSGRRA